MPLIELASSSDINHLLATLQIAPRRRRQPPELSMADLRLGDPRIGHPRNGLGLAYDASLMRSVSAAGQNVVETKPLQNVTRTPSTPQRQVQAVPSQSSRQPQSAYASAARSRKRCQCGTCNRCVEDARWDRIFHEKFADPTYYQRINIRHTSTLASPR